MQETSVLSFMKNIFEVKSSTLLWSTSTSFSDHLFSEEVGPTWSDDIHGWCMS